MEAVPILLVALHVHVALASLVMELLAMASMNETIVHAAAMAHARTQSVHSLRSFKGNGFDCANIDECATDTENFYDNATF